MKKTRFFRGKTEFGKEVYFPTLIISQSKITTSILSSISDYTSTNHSTIHRSQITIYHEFTDSQIHKFTNSLQDLSVHTYMRSLNLPILLGSTPLNTNVFHTPVNLAGNKASHIKTRNFQRFQHLKTQTA